MPLCSGSVDRDKHYIEKGHKKCAHTFFWHISAFHSVQIQACSVIHRRRTVFLCLFKKCCVRHTTPGGETTPVSPLLQKFVSTAAASIFAVSFLYYCNVL